MAKTRDVFANYGADGTAPLLHATAVSFEGSAALILGPSGAGKSGLALELMAYGCTLISDDRVLVQREGTHLLARAPSQVAGRIEAWGVGILAVENAAQSKIALLVDLSKNCEERFPERTTHPLLEVEIPYIQKLQTPAFAAIVLQILKSGLAHNDLGR